MFVKNLICKGKKGDRMKNTIRKMVILTLAATIFCQPATDKGSTLKMK